MKNFINQNIKPLWFIWLYGALAIGYMVYCNSVGDRILSSGSQKWERGVRQHK
jgi:hypothetical protein